MISIRADSKHLLSGTADFGSTVLSRLPQISRVGRFAMLGRAALSNYMSSRQVFTIPTPCSSTPGRAKGLKWLMSVSSVKRAGSPYILRMK
jgi:hypothetical protein